MNHRENKIDELETPLAKVQFFVPKKSADLLMEKVVNAGGGVIGKYDHCFFVTEGHGYFRPLKGSNPTVGKIGKIEKVAESKIEFLCIKDNLPKIIETIKENHPYEEAPIDVIPLLDS